MILIFYIIKLLLCDESSLNDAEKDAKQEKITTIDSKINRRPIKFY